VPNTRITIINYPVTECKAATGKWDFGEFFGRRWIDAEIIGLS
jgi:hypothetical protein